MSVEKNFAEIRLQERQRMKKESTLFLIVKFGCLNNLNYLIFQESSTYGCSPKSILIPLKRTSGEIRIHVQEKTTTTEHAQDKASSRYFVIILTHVQNIQIKTEKEYQP